MNLITEEAVHKISTSRFSYKRSCKQQVVINLDGLTWKRDAKSWNPSSLLLVILKKTFICTRKVCQIQHKLENPVARKCEKKPHNDLPCKVRIEWALKPERLPCPPHLPACLSFHQDCTLSSHQATQNLTIKQAFIYSELKAQLKKT